MDARTSLHQEAMMCIQENPLLTKEEHKDILMRIAEGFATPSLVGRLSRHNAAMQERIDTLSRELNGKGVG